MLKKIITQSPTLCQEQIPRLNQAPLDQAFTDYRILFVQPLPFYSVKSDKYPYWKIKKKALGYAAIRAHLDQIYSVGVCGRWYPAAGIIDIDSRDEKFVDTIRDQLGFNAENSMLCSSESPESYHLLFRPLYKSKPVNLTLFKKVLSPISQTYGVELYPMASKPIRLPFGRHQDCLDDDKLHLTNWQDMLYCFQKLDDYGIERINHWTWEHQIRDDSFCDATTQRSNIFDEAKELLEHGLPGKSTRHESQFKIIYSLFRKNIPLSVATDMVWQWICKKNNGLSQQFNTNPGQVLKEIERQAEHIYQKYDRKGFYPDDTHNMHTGIITKADLIDIINYGESLPQMKFLFEIVRYYYPRRHRALVNVHRDLLVKWSSHATYQKYLNHFEEKELLTRSSHYLAEKFSKPITLKWKFRNSNEAIFYQHRTPDTLYDVLRLAFKAEELRELLKSNNISRSHISKLIKKIYSEK